ncbi:M13 family metallopeptidase [Pinibacter aurantiacus]|uniref:M13 family metallopeptidase n=1 Tax=Pinibacter aurantiacus TaxID=2851599 RepID=A0A9E2S6U2_9BACT|nr:M13 family metallopeptidase [Pinibacter aurantiacus]MBV4355784.1 M13 family metallopeptidase [Pinibacter aurantiacus]
MKRSNFVVGSLITISALTACQTPDKPVAKSLINFRYMDSATKPGDNFYRFINGKWQDTATIPGTETGVGGFLDVENRKRDRLKEIVASVADGKQKEGSIEQKVGDFYLSGMDSTTIEGRGYDPVKPTLQQVFSLTGAKDIMKFVAEQHTLNNNLLFNQGFGADDKNSSMNIAVYSQGGLGLPERDYYFKTDAATQEVVSAYKTFMAKTFALTGDDSLTANKKMNAVYDLEKKMAASHRTAIELRDPQANYNKFAVKDLNKMEPAFAWETTLTDMGVKTDSVNVQQPAFFKAVDQLLTSAPIDAWKAYFQFHVIENAAPALSSAFVNARFAYVKALTGQQAMKPRWERMIRNLDGNLGEALGELYVKKYFTEADKKRMLELVNNLQIAFENRINKLDWMSDSTKTVAKEKLHAFLKKIGYPDKWRDYSKVNIDKSKYFENLVSCGKNEYQYQLSKVGKPVDRTEWAMTPPTVNAYYNPTFNEIVFPAGILQFPFFDPQADDAINYGGIGMVIGHEMTHGFDDQGAQYDKDGNMRNWWAKDDAPKFKAKADLVNTLYDSFTIQDTIHLQGKLTTGENMADIGGIAIAYDAFKLTNQGKDTVRIDGLTPDERFFVSFAQCWRFKLKPESERMYVNIDPHSPAMYRVNGPLMNFTPFYTTFNVQPGEKMFVPEDKRIKIW